MKTKLDMEKAHLLLVGTKISIAEVGYRLGYKSGIPPSFTEETGLTPTQYRRKYQRQTLFATFDEHEGPPLVFTLRSGAHLDLPLYRDLGGKDLVNRLTDLEISASEVRHLGGVTDTLPFQPYHVALPGYHELTTDDHKIVFQVLSDRLRLWVTNKSKYDLTVTVRRHFNRPHTKKPLRHEVDFANLELDDVFLHADRHYRVLDVAEVDLLRRITYRRGLRDDGEQRFTRSHRFLIQDIRRGVERVVDDSLRKWKENSEAMVFPRRVTLVHVGSLGHDENQTTQ